MSTAYSRLLGAVVSCSLVLLSATLAHADNENLLLGNPSRALPIPLSPVPDTGTAAQTPFVTANFDNFLVEKPEYSLSYNRKNGGPNWVSWHLTQSDRGRSGRSNKFAPDTTLLADCQIRPSAYQGSGYDRGHQCPSGDRTSSAQTNAVTFLMSNMLPQAPELNRVLWNNFEEYCRTQIKQGANEEYIVCGGAGTKSTIGGGGTVNVPAQCWKIALILPTGDNDLTRITPQTRVIAILMPNDDAALQGKTWRDFLTSVDKVEAATGYKFLTALPVNVRQSLETKVDSGRAPASSTKGDEGNTPDTAPDDAQ